MKVSRLKISNFRGVKAAELLFDDHVLLLGPNNVGKSTICEALDLVLSPERLNRFPPIEEFDFHNARYLAAPSAQGQQPALICLHVEVVLVDLSEEIENRCGGHTEYWHLKKRRLLETGEADDAKPPDVVSCLRLEVKGNYNPEEDEFEAKTFFSHSPDADPGELTPVSRTIKQLFGFLYLRALRTGSRALSLERGSLLDIILRLKGARTGIWEQAIDRLRELDFEKDTPALTSVLQSIEQRLARYMPSRADGRTTRLHVSQLTRADLRETMAFFLAMSKDQRHVPFRRAGTGTVNTLVLALLSFIAELKPNSVIFAMEEPEVALPPHTQRRIADYLLKHTTQAFVTSHSPFVIERFSPAQTLLLSRTDEATITTKRISDAAGLKDNDFRRYARRGLTECMIGTGVIVVEGLTEFHALPVVARRIEESDANLQPLDIAGVALFDAESDGSLHKFGHFFRSLGLKAFSFYDHKKRPPEAKQRLSDSFEIDCEHPYAGFEDLIVAEVPVERLWTFLFALKKLMPEDLAYLPADRPDDTAVCKITRDLLRGHKGAAWAAHLFEECSIGELPTTIVGFLRQVYARFPKAAEIEFSTEEVASRAPT